MKEEETLEQNQREEPEPFLKKVMTIGFFGGLIWSLVGYITYLLQFTDVGPSLVLQPWALGDWKNETLGQWMGILAISLLSILVALFYKTFLVKVKHISGGILFGVALWFLVFYALQPIFPDLDPMTELDTNTVVTTLCTYILYGIFIGYSIAFEYDENQHKGDTLSKEASV